LEEEFLDDGQEVVKGSDGVERCGVVGPVDPAGGGEQEGGLDDGLGDALLVQLGGEVAIVLSGPGGGVGQ
jgi:hypothetical protein